MRKLSLSSSSTRGRRTSGASARSRVTAWPAEDADNAPPVSALPAVQGVKTVFAGADGPIPSGAMRSFTIEISGKSTGSRS